MTIDEYILKISNAGVNIPQELEMDKRYLVSTEIDIQNKIDKSNNDGSVKRTFVGRQTGNLEILTEGKNIIKAKAKKKVSQSIHGAMWYYHSNRGLTEDFEIFYEREGKKMAAYIDQVMEFLNTKT